MPNSHAAPVGRHPSDGDEQVTRLIHAVEGECDGLAITKDQAVAILSYVLPPCDQEFTPQAEPAHDHLASDLLMAASLMDEAAKMLEAADPEVLEKLPNFRWPLCDELGGAAGILRRLAKEG